MTTVVFLIIVLGVGIGFLAFFLVRSVIAPKRVEMLSGLLRQGKTQAAAKIAKAIIAKEPRNLEAHYLLGQTYLQDAKPELALMEFKIVNQIGAFGPRVPEAEFRRKMAQLFARFAQTEEALKEYVLLTKLEPNAADHFYWTGKLFGERNRGDMALNYLRKAVELDPRHGKAHYELGIMLYRDKKTVEAKSELEASLRFEPDNAQVYYFLGKLHKEAHDYVAALLAFEKAQRDQEYRIKALVERGGCYMSMNTVEKAIPELERAVKLSADDASNETLYARYFLAMCFEKLRDIDKAIEQWEQIYAKKPNFRDVAEKLSHYQEFRADDKMKDYLSSSREEFIEICKAVVTQSLSLQVRDITEIANGVDIIAIESDSAKWRNARKMPRLIRFLRVPDLVDELAVRNMLEEMKKQNMTRITLITSSGFARAAIEFADNRPVDLFNKDQLQELLEKVSLDKLPGYAPARRP
jgi:tetratricopeptide (TPR) repeat protein